MIPPLSMARSWLACLATCATAAVSMSSGAAAQHAPQALAVSAHKATIHPGDVVRLDVSCACMPSNRPGTAHVFNRPVPLVAVPDTTGWSALIGVDVETAPGAYPINVSVVRANGLPLAATYTLTVVTKQFPTRRLRVAPVYVEPPPAERNRIAADAARLDAIYATTTWPERFGPFQAPVRVAAQNTFGARSIFNGQPRSLHAGVDFSSPAGAPIAAPAAAVVVLADDLFFTGRTVVLDHGRGLISVLAHMSTMAVAAGEPVQRGDVVGTVGATGRATGPHLHWSTRLNRARVDPMSLLEVMGAAR